MPRLLVSVRNAAEAAVALASRADLIDVKEPGRGPLGRADDEVIAAVVQCVAGRRPVSAALGELSSAPLPFKVPGLSYIKWGLAGWGDTDAWQSLLREFSLQHPSLAVVPVAYADWQRASAPSVEEVCTFVARNGKVLLIDTFEKVRGASLLNYLTVREITALCSSCRSREIQVALAGSLTLAHLAALKRARPDWFAVRGAACLDCRRDSPLDPYKTWELAAAVGGGAEESTLQVQDSTES